MIGLSTEIAAEGSCNCDQERGLKVEGMLSNRSNKVETSRIWTRPHLVAAIAVKLTSRAPLLDKARGISWRVRQQIVKHTDPKFPWQAGTTLGTCLSRLPEKKVQGRAASSAWL